MLLTFFHVGTVGRKNTGISGKYLSRIYYPRRRKHFEILLRAFQNISSLIFIHIYTSL